jgi:hypothetical protein
MNNNYYKSPKPSWLMRQFWKACGADAYLLERSTYSDQIKYFCLGGIVVATGVMAAMAGGYAIYTIFEPKGQFASNKEAIHISTMIFSIVFGIIWGLIIYNIDRFIVTSTGKGDGTEAITGQEIRSSIPRIIMGMIIALTISKPIEIRMFKSEIDAEITKMQKGYLNELDSATTNLWDQKILPFQFESDSLKKANEDRRNEISQQRRRLEDEAAGNLPPNPPGRGPAWKDKKENLDKMEAENNIQRKSNEKRISDLSWIIKKYEKRKDDEFKTNEEKKSSMDGLLLRLKLAHKIAGFWISLFITLLFMVIELTPIFFKMMLIKGPYDYMDENVKELARAEAGIEIIYNYYEDGQGMEAHKVVNHAAELKAKERLLILKAQDELNEEIVRKWKEKKLKDIKENPDQYIDEQ